MITISKELLKSAGYKCWLENPEFEPHIVKKWQKRIIDDLGIKYFININETEGLNPDLNSDEEFHNFWPFIQFDIEVPGFGFQSIQVSLVQWFNESGKFSQITIEKMEELCEQIFQKLNGQYYEIRTI